MHNFIFIFKVRYKKKKLIHIRFSQSINDDKKSLIQSSFLTFISYEDIFWRHILYSSSYTMVVLCAWDITFYFVIKKLNWEQRKKKRKQNRPQSFFIFYFILTSHLKEFPIFFFFFFLLCRCRCRLWLYVIWLVWFKTSCEFCRIFMFMLVFIACEVNINLLILK